MGKMKSGKSQQFRKLLFIIFTIYYAYVVWRELTIEFELLDSKNSDPIILYDGVCNLCNGVVNFVLETDNNEIFKFTSLQSQYATDLLRKHNIVNDLSTVVLIEKEKVFIKSTAALRVAKRLDFPFNLIYYSAIGIPTPIRDFGYSLVATSRYFVFGKTNQCQAPTAKYNHRFLGEYNNLITDLII